MSTRLETARLVIRTFESRDGEAWVAMVNDPEVVRFLPPGPARTMETFQAVIDGRHAMGRECEIAGSGQCAAGRPDGVTLEGAGSPAIAPDRAALPMDR